MRNLTIKRAKRFVACLGKMKIYIEDPTSNEMFIGNTPCRKLGELKNGEEKTFQVEEQAAKIFVIGDKLSKNYCNEFYQLPAGEEDIVLTGKNVFNIAAGNAFRFDNNESADVLANRKQGKRKGLVVAIVAVAVGAIIGGFAGRGITSLLLPDPSTKTKTFSSEGISVTLTEAFRETNVGNYTAVFESKDVAVFALREAFALAEGVEDYTLRQYCELVMEANGMAGKEIITGDGLMRFEYTYTNPETNDTYRYYSFVYKAEDAFWLVQFTTLDKNASKYAEKIIQWAKTVEFNSKYS